MADTLTSITNLINSPPGQLVAGGVLAGIVWKFFERIETLLTDQTKFEIAVWLVSIKPADKPSWPMTFMEMYQKVFGDSHPSWKGIRASTVATCFAFILTYAYISPYVVRSSMKLLLGLSPSIFIELLALVLGSVFYVLLRTVQMAIPDYAAVVSLQWAVTGSIRKKRASRVFLTSSIVIPVIYSALCIVISDLNAWLLLKASLIKASNISPDISTIASWYFHEISFPAFVWKAVQSASVHEWVDTLMTVFPLYLGTAWLLLYVGSGFLLKLGRRFDIGFQWFNSKFDIEKKPLQSIGLVAGTLVAVVYWGVVGGAWALQHLAH